MLWSPINLMYSAGVYDKVWPCAAKHSFNCTWLHFLDQCMPWDRHLNSWSNTMLKWGIPNPRWGKGLMQHGARLTMKKYLKKGCRRHFITSGKGSSFCSHTRGGSIVLGRCWSVVPRCVMTCNHWNHEIIEQPWKVTCAYATPCNSYALSHA